MKVILFIHFHYIHRIVVTQLSPCMVKMDLTASIDRNQAVAGSETILAWRFKSRPRSRATLINSHNSAKILIRILYNFWFWKSIKSVLCDTDIALFRATTQLENYTLHICFPHEPVSVMRTVHYSMHACISSVGYAHNTRLYAGHPPTLPRNCFGGPLFLLYFPIADVKGSVRSQCAYTC